MKAKYIKFLVLFLGSAVFLSSCLEDLDTVPLDPNVTTSATFYNYPESYEMVLAKLYGGLSLTGQTGPHGNPDILGIDEGFSNYIRAYWYMQEITTEMGLWTWNDPGVPELQTNSWTPTNAVITGMYYRLFYQIALANELIRESSPERLSERGFSNQQKEQIALFRAEARFLRALSYKHALDLFGSVPFVTENDPIGAFLPQQISRADLFLYVESELKALTTLLAQPRTNVYGRVDRAAAWLLLARLYLNAEVYINARRYTEAITYSRLVMESGYELDPNYRHLFLADNHLSEEIIFPVVSDGINAQSWGGITMIACASWSADMNAAAHGINPWGGLRARRQLVEKFADHTGATDSRAMFFTQGRTISTDEISTFTNGYSVMKFKNITRTGALGSNNLHMDIDFPLMRLADAYLIFAEAVLRGGTGATPAEALAAVNEIRDRAYGNTTGRITQADLTLDFILDERAREFYWEGHRRTDLVRFGRFTSSQYLWEWKGGVFEGRGLPAHFNWFPIPASDIAANPNLRQTGY